MQNLSPKIAAGKPAGPDLDWLGEGIPVARRYGDPYFSLKGGLDEARHVFLAGNDLPARLRNGFHLAELGFGTGLNLIALAGIAGCPVRFTSFEAEPMSAAQMRRALDAFPQTRPLAEELLRGWSGAAGPVRRLQLRNVSAEILIGDARRTLPDWPGRADAWFLDGFAPAKNPELWSPALMAEIGRHTAPGGSFATYSAAGHVRRALADAGFEVERRPGFAGKKHMSAGRIP